MKLDSLGDWRRTHYSDEVSPDLHGKEVTMLGWVQNIRDLGGIKFIILGDREGDIQVTIPMTKASQAIVERAQELKKQYVFALKGTVKKSDKTERGVEIVPNEMKVLNVAQHPLPMDPTGRTHAEIDVRLNARALDLRRPENRAVFVINHHVAYAIREFLSRGGFIEVQTPKIIATATEGGAALFPVLYFGKEAFLAQSPQLYKEQLTTCFEKVFEIAPYFRAEESRTSRHTSEFISVDIEQAFATCEDVVKVAEELLAFTVDHVKKNCQKELRILGQDPQVPKLPLKRYSYDEIIEELRSDGVEIKWGEDIPTPALRTLGERHKDEYYFILNWPTKAKAFYIKPREDNPEISEGFDFMYSWMELASGGTRIHDKELLIKRMKEQDLNPESFDYHLKVFDTGMAPHAGWGMGFSRVTMILTGRDNIRECVLFPRDRFRLTP
ncbi:MAG: aspartate--tRNA(Asn) ligase [Candidatus Bathyarchaeia archaeon]